MFPVQWIWMLPVSYIDLGSVPCFWFFAGTRRSYNQEDQSSHNHWDLWGTNDCWPMQHGCGEAWWLPCRSGLLNPKSVICGIRVVCVCWNMPSIPWITSKCLDEYGTPVVPRCIATASNIPWGFLRRSTLLLELTILTSGLKNSSSVLISMECHLFSSVFRTFIRMFHRTFISLIACFCCSRGLSVPCLLNPAGRTNRMASYSGRSHMNRVTPWGPESWRVAEHPFMWQPAACFGFETGREITCPETDWTSCFGINSLTG